MSNPLGSILQWFQNAITGVYTPSVGMYDTSIGLAQGTPITSPVNGIILGNGFGGFYGAFGQQDWGGELDILTNLQGYGNQVVVDILHFDTLAPGLQPGQTVTAGQYLGTSGGQTSGGNWPSLSKYSTGPHIGIGVRSPYGFTPAYDASSLVYQLRSGSVVSSVPNVANNGPSPAYPGPVGGILNTTGTAVGGLVQGALANYNPAKLVAALEQDLLGYSIRAGFVVFGLLLVLVGVIIFFSAHPQEEQSAAQQIGIPTASQAPEAGEAGGAGEVAEVGAVAA